MENEVLRLQEALAAFEDYAPYDATNLNQQLLLREECAERYCMPTALAWQEHREEFLMRSGEYASV
jgi:hypothetical protein